MVYMWVSYKKKYEKEIFGEAFIPQNEHPAL